MQLFKNIPLEQHLSEAVHPWLLFMTWRDLLFASWRIPVEALRSKVPPELELDTFDGSAWVTLVPMGVTDMHWRGIPPIPGMEGFRELNLRTYIKRNDRPGIYFLSIECPAAFSDWIARHFFGVPYFEAQIAAFSDGATFHFASERTAKNQPPAALFSTFRPATESFPPAPGSLASFLVERYCLYFVHGGEVYRGDIHHGEWKLHNAEAELDVNTITKAAGVELAAKPDHTVFVAQTDTLIWPPVREH
jgi:uncharacterized protein YqjF (DUF2071 family)